MKYILNKPYINKLEFKYVNSVLRTGWLSIGGKYNKLFEKFGN